VDIARDGLEAAAKLDVNAYDVVWSWTATCPASTETSCAR